MGFWASKVLLTAVNMGLFTLLAEGGLSGQEIKTKLGLHERSLYDFLDTLCAWFFETRRFEGNFPLSQCGRCGLVFG